MSDQQVPAAGWRLSIGSLLLLGRSQHIVGTLHMVSHAYFFCLFKELFLFVCFKISELKKTLRTA